MDDFTYDCLQKKRLAQQVKYRKCGSKSKKCPMSTDHMTNKQWKERCGKIVAINLNKPVSWEVFKELSKQTQEEYIQGLMKNYGANATSLAAMFDVQPLTVRRYIAANKLDVSFQVGHSMNTEQKLAWERFMAGDKADMAPENTKCVQAEPTPMLIHEVMSMSRFSVSFSGPIDAAMIANTLRNILGDNASGDVEIVCNLR